MNGQISLQIADRLPNICDTVDIYDKYFGRKCILVIKTIKYLIFTRS